MTRWIALLALIATPTLAQTPAASTRATQMVVVRDATTGVVEMIIVPDHDGETTDPGELKPTLDAIPNAVVDNVPIAQVKAKGFAAALTAVDPQAVAPAPLQAQVQAAPVGP